MRLEDLNISDAVVLSRLAAKGRQTKLQLLSLGLTGWMIEKLTKYGILTLEYDPTTNLHYYNVADGYRFNAAG